MALVSKYSLNWNANDLAWSNNWTANSVTWVDWKANQWLYTSWTSSSNVTIPDSTSLRFSTMSICAYIKINWTQWSNEWVIMRKDTESWTRYLWWFSQNESSQNIRFVNYNWSLIFQSTKTSVGLGWHYYVWIITWSGWSLSLYYDWILVSTESISTFWDATSAITIWRDPVVTNVNRAWSVDEVEIYNHVLTPAEIKNKYLYLNWFI